LELKGSCAQCGYCCTNIHTFFANSEATREWCRARNLTIVQETDKVVEVSIPSVCPHFDTASKSCELHGKFDDSGKHLKPEICRSYPRGVIESHLQMGTDPRKSIAMSKGWTIE